MCRICSFLVPTKDVINFSTARKHQKSMNERTIRIDRSSVVGTKDRSESGGMLFYSDLCDQTFTQYSSLQKHARVHDKKKPYRCEHPGCDQAFSQVSNLIRHQRIHTGEKPYICEICNKQFASGSNLKQHLQIHDKQDVRNQFKCIFESCDKRYLYPSSLKKHYMVSHREQYESYLQDQKIETCGFHLKDGEDMEDQEINEDSQLQQIEMIRPKTDMNEQQRVITGLGSTFTSLASAQRKINEQIPVAGPKNQNKRLFSQTQINQQQEMALNSQAGVFSVSRTGQAIPVIGEQSGQVEQQNDLIDRMLPKRRQTIMGGFNPNSNFSSANSNMGSNSFMLQGFGGLGGIRPPQIDQRNMMMGSAEARDEHQLQNNQRVHELLPRQGSLESMTVAHNSDSFVGGAHHGGNLGGLSNQYKFLLGHNIFPSSLLPSIKNEPQQLQTQAFIQPNQLPVNSAGTLQQTSGLMKTGQFKNPEPALPIPSGQPLATAHAQAQTSHYLNLIQSYLNKLQQTHQQVQMQSKTAALRGGGNPETTSISDFIINPGQQQQPQVNQEKNIGNSRKESDPSEKIVSGEKEEEKESATNEKNIKQEHQQKMSSISRQASAAMEIASNHSLTSVLSPSVCIRQPFGGQMLTKQELLNANHGSLGMVSDANHCSGTSVQQNSRFKYKACNIKHSRPKILVQDGHSLLQKAGETLGYPISELPPIVKVDRAYSSDNLARANSHTNEPKNSTKDEQLRRVLSHEISELAESQEIENELIDEEEVKKKIGVEESLFKSNITNEIEDINKKPPQQGANTSTVNTSASSNQANNVMQMSSAFSIVRHLFPTAQEKQQQSTPKSVQRVIAHQSSQQSASQPKKSQFFPNIGKEEEQQNIETHQDLNE